MKDRVIAVIQETLTLKKEINMSDRLRDDLQADSLDMVELSLTLEDEFNIKLSDDEATTIETVLDVINLIEGKI